MTAYHATKYGSARDEVVAVLADMNEGFGREAFGDVESPVGYVQFVRLDESCDLDFSDHTNYQPGDHAGEVAREYGVTAADVHGIHVVTTNSQGFVTVTSFLIADEETAANLVQDLSLAYEEWRGDEE